MDSQQFDQFARVLGQKLPRRSALALFGGVASLAAGLGGMDVLGRRNDKGRNKQQKKRRKKRKRRNATSEPNALLVAGEASGPIYDALSEQFQMVAFSANEPVNLGLYQGVVVDHKYHGEDSLSGFEVLREAHALGKRIYFLDTNEDLMRSVHVAQFGVIGVQARPGYVLTKRLAQGGGLPRVHTTVGVGWPLLAENGDTSGTASWMGFEPEGYTSVEAERKENKKRKHRKHKRRKANETAAFEDAFSVWMDETDRAERGSDSGEQTFQDIAKLSTSGEGALALYQSQIMYMRVSSRIQTNPSDPYQIAPHPIYGSNQWVSQPTCTGVRHPLGQVGCYLGYCGENQVVYTPNWVDRKGCPKSSSENPEIFSQNRIRFELAALIGLQDDTNTLDLLAASQVSAIPQVQTDDGVAKFQIYWNGCGCDSGPVQTLKRLVGYNALASFAIPQPYDWYGAPVFDYAEAHPKNGNQATVISTGKSHSRTFTIGSTIGYASGPQFTVEPGFEDSWSWENSQQTERTAWSYLTSESPNTAGMTTYSSTQKVSFNTWGDSQLIECDGVKYADAGFCPADSIRKPSEGLTVDASKLNELQRAELTVNGQAYYVSKPTGSGHIDVFQIVRYAGGFVGEIGDMQRYEQVGSFPHYGVGLHKYQYMSLANYLQYVTFDTSSPALNRTTTPIKFKVMKIDPPDLPPGDATFEDFVLTIMPDADASTARYTIQLFLGPSSKLSNPLPDEQVVVTKAVYLDAATGTPLADAGKNILGTSVPIPQGQHLAITLRCYFHVAVAYAVKATVHSDNPSDGRFNLDKSFQTRYVSPTKPMVNAGHERSSVDRAESSDEVPPAPADGVDAEGKRKQAEQNRKRGGYDGEPDGRSTGRGGSHRGNAKQQRRRADKTGQHGRANRRSTSRVGANYD